MVSRVPVIKGFVWIVLFSWIAAYPCRASLLRKFGISGVRGTVVAWQPWTSEWRKVKSGDEVWEGTMVQVGADSTFTFSIVPEMNGRLTASGLRAETLRITINSPMVLRIQTDIPRKVTLEDYFIAKLPDVTESDQAHGGQLFNSITEAWNRFAAVVLPQKVKEKFFDSVLKEQFDATESASAKKIRIYFPVDGSIIVADRLPHEFRIAWRKVSDPDATYGVRVWREEERRPAPLGLTRQDYYAVKVFREGAYYCQVITSDGKWQSDVRRLSVVLPMSNRGYPPNITTVNKPLALDLPPKDFIYVTGSFPASVSFQWERPNTAVTEQVYEFSLYNQKGETIFKKRTGELGITTKFGEPGSFKWSVSAFPQELDNPSPGQTVYSEKRNFALRDYKLLGTKLQGHDPIHDLLSTNSGVLYLELGL